MSKKQQEIVEDVSHKLNQLIVTQTIRKTNGTLRESLDFSYCPSMAEQHTAHESDLNYLVNKYKPDELAAYIAARAQYRKEILGRDFSKEPSLQAAKNEVYRLKTKFESLPEEIRTQFKNHVEFLKFIDNPANQQKMIKLGLLAPEQIKELSTDPLPKNDDLNDDKKKGPDAPSSAKK